MQELIQYFETLEARITGYEARIAALEAEKQAAEARIAALEAEKEKNQRVLTALKADIEELQSRPYVEIEDEDEDFEVEEPIEEEDTSVEPEEYAEAMAFLDKVFESIPPKCKSILKRFYWDKLPMSEIAAIHGLRNENTAKTTKNRCMDKFKEIAKAMLADDAKADEAVRRTVERNALRDLLEEIRKEKDGEWARAALDGKDKGK